MAQNSNISISSGTTRFINAPIGRKKRAVSGKKPETYRLTHREENNGSLPVSRESTPNQRAGMALRGGLFWTP